MERKVICAYGSRGVHGRHERVVRRALETTPSKKAHILSANNGAVKDKNNV